MSVSLHSAQPAPLALWHGKLKEHLCDVTSFLSTPLSLSLSDFLVPFRPPHYFRLAPSTPALHKDGLYSRRVSGRSNILRRVKAFAAQ